MNIIEDVTLPGREGGAWTLKQGQHIRIIDVEGGPIGDFVCFNANNLSERFSQARTKANQGKFILSEGDHLYSRDNNPILSIVRMRTSFRKACASCPSALSRKGKFRRTCCG